MVVFLLSIFTPAIDIVGSFIYMFVIALNTFGVCEYPYTHRLLYTDLIWPSGWMLGLNERP